MEKNKYINAIENNKNIKSFYDLFESDEYNEIKSNEDKRKIFYLYALNFSSSKKYKNIFDLFKDLKKLLENMDKENYLKKYDQECYITIISNYIDKIEIIISERKFFEDKENYNAIRDIINKFKSYFSNKGEVPKEIVNNLEEFYEILTVKQKFKVLGEKKDRMSVYLKEYKDLINKIKAKINNQRDADIGYKNEIKDNNIVVTKKYLESFSVYGDNAEDFWDVLVEIIVIIIGMITTFFYRYNFMMIIKNLTPAHIIFLSPIYFFIFKIVLVFGNLIIRIFDKGTLMNNYTVESIKEIFALDILGDVFSFIGFLIYLEIIELNFCNLNFNLRKNITQRGVDETISFIDNDNGDLNESLNEEIERNESEKENNNKSLNLVSIKK